MNRVRPVEAQDFSQLAVTRLRTQEWVELSAAMKSDGAGLLQSRLATLNGPVLEAVLLAEALGRRWLRAAVADQCRLFLHDLGAAGQSIPDVRKRVAIALASLHHWDELGKFLALGGLAKEELLSFPASDGVDFDLPMRGRLQEILGDTAVRAKPQHLPHIAVLDTCRWLDDHRLEIGGAAFIPGLPADDGFLEMALVLSDGWHDSLSVPVRRVDKPRLGEVPEDPWGYYGEAGFSSVVDVRELTALLEDLPGSGRLAAWNVAVELTAAGATRRATFQKRSYGQVMRTLLTQRVVGDIYVSPEFSGDTGLRLAMRRAAVVAHSTKISGRTVDVHFREHGETQRFTKVVARMGAASAVATVENDSSGSRRAILTLPDDASLGQEFPQWTLRAVTDAGIERGLGWDLSGPMDEGYVYGSDTCLVATENAAGNLTLIDTPAFLLLQSVNHGATPDTLDFVFQGLPTGSVPGVQLRGAPPVELPPVRASPDGSLALTVTIPASGSYDLVCALPGEMGAHASVIRVGKSLASEAAVLSTPAAEVILAARTRRGVNLRVRTAATASRRRYVSKLLSVVVPMHNADVYIQDCLNSVLGQSYENVEVIVVDDGSTDVSADIVRDFRKKDARVRLIHQDRRGPGAARDRGVQSARGEFLTFVDSDDMVEDDGFVRLIASLTQSKSDFAVAGVQVFQGQKLLPVPWQAMLNHSARSRQTLPTAPVALRRMSVVGAAFRRSFWNAKALRFGASRAFEGDRPMLNAYSAGTFDLLPDVVYRWRLWTQREKQADEEILVERALGVLPSWRATTEDLAGFPDGLREFESHILEHVLLKNAMQAVSHDFAELRLLAQGNCREILAGVNKEAWFGLSMRDRIILQLVAAGQFDLLARFLEHNAPAFAFAPLEHTTEGVVYSAPMIEEIAPYLSGDTLLRPYSSLPSVSVLTSVRWSEDEKTLLVEGAAYIDGLAADPDNLRIGLDLVGPDGLVFPAKVERTVDPRIDQFSQDPHNSYAQACFIARIDFDGIIDDAGLPERAGFVETYAVRLTLHSPEAERSCAFERMHHFRIMQTLLSREYGNQVWITPEFNKVDGLRIRLRRSAVWAVDAGLENRTLSLLLEEFGPQLQFRFLRLTAAGQSVRSELVRDPGNVLRGSIEVPEGLWPSSLSSGLRHWTVDAVTEDGRTRRIGWALNGGTDAEGSIENAERSLRLTRTSQGNVTLTDDPLWTEVADVRFGPELASLVFEVRTSSPEAVPAFELSSDRHTFSGFAVKELATDLYELTFDLTVADWGQMRPVPPSGRYYLRRVAATDSVRSYSAVTSVAQELAARSNRLDCSRVAVHLGASHAGTFRVTFQPVLTPEEKTQRGQLALHRRHVEEPVLALDPEAFFFRCYFGEVANDSQVELHKEARRRWPQARLYWEVSDFSVALPEGGIPVVKRSEAWYQARSTATYTFSNNDADWWKLRRPGQTVVQTFHGHPFKRMGRSRWLSLGVGPERVAHRIEVKNDQWSHIVSQSPKATELYAHEYGFRGQMLELGYPRNDVFKGPQATRTANDTRRLLGIDASKTVVLYAPTWRESDQRSTTQTVVSDLFDAKKVAEELGPDYVLLMRGHRYSSSSGPVDRGAARIIDVTAYPDSADLCLASDIGVFDYSSMRFDYAVTGKPMIFYVPDYSLYENERGWLFPYEDSAPGPLVFDEYDLTSRLRSWVAWIHEYSDQYSAFLREFAPFEDGKATIRIIDSVVKLPRTTQRAQENLPRKL